MIDKKRRKKLRPAAILVPVFAYLVLSIVSLHWSNPFRVAVEHAAELGDWEVDEVVFSGGSYGYRLLYSVAEADLVVATETGRQDVHIELRNVPLAGWQVFRFERRPAS